MQGYGLKLVVKSDKTTTPKIIVWAIVAFERCAKIQQMGVEGVCVLIKICYCWRRNNGNTNRLLARQVYAMLEHIFYAAWAWVT